MIDSGDTAWMLTSTALVLFMTLPGLALFYAGLVQSRNVLSVLMHCMAIACARLGPLVHGRLQPGVRSRLAHLIGGLGRSFLAGIARDAVSSRDPHPGNGVRHVPDDFRHHHARP